MTVNNTPALAPSPIINNNKSASNRISHLANSENILTTLKSFGEQVAEKFSQHDNQQWWAEKKRESILGFLQYQSQLASASLISGALQALAPLGAKIGQKLLSKRKENEDSCPNGNCHNQLAANKKTWEERGACPNGECGGNS